MRLSPYVIGFLSILLATCMSSIADVVALGDILASIADVNQF